MYREITNTLTSIKGFVKELTNLPGFTLQATVFCMEHTGIYNNYILEGLHKSKANICMQAASQIKSSLGNIRGKNDKVDSIRIAEYAYRCREEIRLWQPKIEVVQRLSHLASTRSGMLEAQKALGTALREKEGFVQKTIVKENLKMCQRTLKAIQEDLESIEKGHSKYC